MKNIKSTTKEKDTFIKIVLPLIIDENNKILENRKKLFKILGKPSNTMGEKRWLKRRFDEYQIDNEDISDLKLKMDIIPVSVQLPKQQKKVGGVHQDLHWKEMQCLVNGLMVKMVLNQRIVKAKVIKY